MADVVLIANTIATAVMVGVIWFVQMVHYPLLARFGASLSTDVAVEHQRRTGWVVAAPMSVEGVTTLLLLATRPAGVSLGLAWVGALLLSVALASTVLLSVPLHAQMARAHDEAVGRRLVCTNWPRTIAWTGRAAICAAMCVQALGV